MINSRIMKVKSIAECSNGSILQYFRPSLSYRLSLRSLFCLLLSGSFTQVLLYNILLLVHCLLFFPLWLGLIVGSGCMIQFMCVISCFVIISLRKGTLFLLLTLFVFWFSCVHLTDVCLWMGPPWLNWRRGFSS